MPISSITASHVYDSRGFPTLEVNLVTGTGSFRSTVPCGVSVGKHETLDLRDRDPLHWHGRGVEKVIAFVNNLLAPAICGKPDLEEFNQAGLDKILLEQDGTENKSRLGANAILGVSMAICKAGAAKKGIPLFKHIANLAGNKNVSVPIPIFNVINGGRHSGNKLAFQEFQIIPKGAKSFVEAMKMCTETYLYLGDQINQKYGQYASYVGDEGGFTPNVQDNEECIRLVSMAIEQCGYLGKVFIGLDVAATQLYKNGMYDLDFKNPKSNPSNFLNGEQMLELYESYALRYPIISITDPFEQDKWDDWVQITAGFTPKRVQIVADDLCTTNPRRIVQAVAKNACHTMIVKANQIGSLTELFEACKMAQTAGWGCIVSHRAGDTEDSFIADLVVGLGAGQFKAGAPCRSEHVAKYNQLLRIEEELGAQNSRFGSGNFRTLADLTDGGEERF